MSSKVFCFKINDEKDLMHCFWSFSDGYFFRGHANAKWLLQTTLERRYSDYHKESFKTGILEHHIEKKEEKYFLNAFRKDLTIIGGYAAIQKYCRLNSLLIADGKNFAVEVLAKNATLWSSYPVIRCNHIIFNCLVFFFRRIW